MISRPIIYTIGHSNRSLAEFLELLREHSVKQLVDVRRFPGSRSQPQFQKDTLANALADEGARYHHLESLGGRRSAVRGSTANAGWTELAFRGYADYALTDPFREGLNDLVRLALQAPSAIMCAEAVPWRCHRRIIADYLMLTRGFEVRDIIGHGRATPHKPPSFAHPEGDRVLYPAPNGAGPPPAPSSFHGSSDARG